MNNFSCFFVGFLLLAGEYAFANDKNLLPKDVDCISGDVVEIPMTIEGEAVGKVIANSNCLDKDPMTPNPNNGLTGSVSFALCSSDFLPCSKKQKTKRVAAYLTVLVPKSETVTQQANWYRKNSEPVRTEEGLDVYEAYDPKRRIYISNTENAFNVRCFEGMKDCEMTGLVFNNKLQYFLRLPANQDAASWKYLDLKVRNFISGTVKIK